MMRGHDLTGWKRSPIRGRLSVLVIPLVLGGLAMAEDSDDSRSPTVGMAGTLNQLVLPGPQLEAIPIRDRQSPIVVRIVDVYPHGESAFRYDLTYYGLEPGDFDLRDHLKRTNGSATADLPPIPVTIRAILPAGQIEPNALVLRGSPTLGGYRLLMVAGSVAWFLVMVAILNIGRRRQTAARAVSARPATLAERLRPMVEQAMAGDLAPQDQAELERLLIGYWRRRLDLEDTPPALAMATMREHDQAGPLFLQLEQWLHNPDGAREPSDIAGLLAPYADLPADELEAQAIPTGNRPRALEGRPA